MAEANTSYVHLEAETLQVLRNDTLDQLRKLSGVGVNHSINGRSVSLPSRNELIQCLADIDRAISSQSRQNAIIATGGTFNGVHTTHPSFSRHF